MLILPLDHPEPFAATLGVMIYPGTDELDARRARAFAAQFLAEPVRRSVEAGHELPNDVSTRLLVDAGEPLTDIQERWREALLVGEVFKVLFILAKNDADLASWSNAIKLVDLAGKRARSKGARTALWQLRRRYFSVAHLWAAWSIREGKFGALPAVGYSGYDDFQCFLTEAEILRDFGQNWRPRRAKSQPPLPADVYRVPNGWSPPARKAGWPYTGMIPDLTLPEELLAQLRPAGRPSAKNRG